MSALTMISQVGSTIFGVVVTIFILYYLVAGIREYREEERVKDTERMWDQEQAELHGNEDIIRRSNR